MKHYSISKKYIEEILKKIEIEKERKCNTLSDEEIENLETEIIGLIKIIKSDDMSVWIARDGEMIDDISLMNLDISKEKTYHKSESLMSELDNYITLNLSRVQNTNKQEPLKNKITELEKSIKLQEEAYNNNKNKAIELRNIATELSKANSYIEIFKGKNIEIIKYRKNVIKIPFIDSEKELEENIAPIKLSSLCFDYAKKMEKKIKAIEIASNKLKGDLEKTILEKNLQVSLNLN